MIGAIGSQPDQLRLGVVLLEGLELRSERRRDRPGDDQRHALAAGLAGGAEDLIDTGAGRLPVRSDELAVLHGLGELAAIGVVERENARLRPNVGRPLGAAVFGVALDLDRATVGGLGEDAEYAAADLKPGRVEERLTRDDVLGALGEGEDPLDRLADAAGGQPRERRRGAEDADKGAPLNAELGEFPTDARRFGGKFVVGGLRRAALHEARVSVEAAPVGLEGCVGLAHRRVPVFPC